MATGTELIQNALIEVGVFAPGQALQSADSTFVLAKLNKLINSWATEKSLALFFAHTSYAFGTSKQSYTIGPSAADFTATRPVKIESANVLLVASTPNARLPLQVIHWDGYGEIPVPAQSSTVPIRLYYQPTNPNGTLWPWPFPTDTGNRLELFTWNQLAAISGAQVGNDYPLPPGYEDALTLSLAEDLVGPYGVASEIDVARLGRRAAQARAKIQALNSQPPRISTRDSGMPGGGRGANILTGMPR